MASELQSISLENVKALATRHFSKLVGVAVGVSSVLLLSVTWSLLTSRSDVTLAATTCSRTREMEGGGLGVGGDKGRAGPGGMRCTGESCPWQYVLSDLTHRLHLLEAAFKEQVLAREMMAQEVSNQTDSNLLIERKLQAFLRKVDEVEKMVRKLENRLNELSTRLHSDEFIGFVVILAIMVEVLLRVRPRVAGHIRPWGSDIMARYRRWSQGTDITTINAAATINTPAAAAVTTNGGSPNGGNRTLVDGRVTEGVQESTTFTNGSAPQNGVSFSPKHGLFLKPELCVITFRKDHTPLTSFVNATVRHLDDVRVSVRPYYVIEGHEDLRQCPRAKLYLVIFEMEERERASSGNSCSYRTQDAELITATVRYVKSFGANLILVVTNDEGSKKLTVHALYNTHLRLLQSHEAFQDLTSSGRVFSAWKELTSHQTSHMRKIVKSSLSLKTSLR
ncbi:uncharacterized protein LOC143298242 isoform X2 [Babylonia areolata]|uniref:uncharacterized protein LOC143298242 isoform X2 n=1 Tax=Babylonia areolata TaxID=304850 RepID=UPI003FD30C60